jgi:glycosyltransferase involved in cell wall biosynthesis
MKIAMIGSRGIDSFYSGVEKTVRELGVRLLHRGHEITVFSQSGKNLPNTYHGARIRRIPSIQGKHTETLVRSLLSALASSCEDYDVIHYHAEGPGLFSLLSRLVGKKTVLTVQGLDWKRDKWSPLAQRCLRAAEQLGAECAHQVVVVSNTLKAYFLQSYGKKTTYIPNGVPRQDAVTTVDQIRSIGLAPRQYCLFASRLVPEKGCHELIQAYNSLDTDMKLVVAGGSRYAEDYVNYLKAIANPQQVIFTGHIEGDLLTELFANAYIFILPSHIEGLSNALLEALSHKKCTLVSNIPENLEVIKDCGYSFRVEDKNDLHEKLRMLLQFHHMVEEMENRVSNLIQYTYNWEHIADMYEEVYSSLCNN